MHDFPVAAVNDLEHSGKEKKKQPPFNPTEERKKIRGQIIKRIIKVEKTERGKKGACERRQLLGARPLTNSLRFLEGVDRKASEGQLLGGGGEGEVCVEGGCGGGTCMILH